MSRVRTAPAWAWIAAVLVLAALALGTAAWSGASPSSSAGPSAEPPAGPSAEPSAVSPSPDTPPVPAPRPVPNPDGTVGPVVALGDSLTADLSWATPPGQLVYPSWFTAALAEEPRLVVAANAGLPGDTTQGMLARFAADVAVHAPRVVVILGGTNDLPLGRTSEQMVGTLEQLADLARDIGAIPVLATIPPRTDVDFRPAVVHLNAAIRRSAASSGTPVIDFWSVLADEDGGWRAGYTWDGIHPTPAGAEAMGRIAVQTLVGG